ncbi:hypothetical protein [Pontibacillus marinus]|uniref:Cytochrome c oxidase n=1 Tax=Pontibacillus marinus BH030004 = DSM 16465 TaxID=1385511 RepID=A0A0A5GEK8_9BACI|nr:hypothetical protein [Pontibacillus marinus]KGX89545.1 hypothetical protein N783_05430 [Pontibacillus marinus BH030004 = DSM 16465]
MGIRFIKLATIYFLIGIGLGIFMEMAHDHALMGVHAHINLVGWVSMALFGLLYHYFPQLANNKLGKAHFWLHNLSLPLFMLGLGFLLYGNESLLLLVIVGSNVLAISVIVFVVNVFKNLKVDTS